jgi:hypothetical protein
MEREGRGGGREGGGEGGRGKGRWKGRAREGRKRGREGEKREGGRGRGRARKCKIRRAQMQHTACNTQHATRSMNKQHANGFSGGRPLSYYFIYYTHHYTHYFIMSSMRCLNSGLFIRLLAICESVVPCTVSYTHYQGTQIDSSRNTD